jgi:hypothetical protein
MSSEKQVAANRQNSLKGGVKSEEGKAVSRLNARKHGIFAAALTPEDSEECAGIEQELIASLRPVGRVEEMLVEKIALTYLRMQRCARAEAEFHIRTWQEPHEEFEERRWEVIQQLRAEGVHATPFREEVFERMVKLVDLYDARLTNQWLKLLHEIERLQRLRKAHDRETDDGGQSGPSNAHEQSAGVAPPPSAVVRSVPVRASEEAPAVKPRQACPARDGATTSGLRARFLAQLIMRSHSSLRSEWLRIMQVTPEASGTRRRASLQNSTDG